MEPGRPRPRPRTAFEETMPYPSVSTPLSRRHSTQISGRAELHLREQHTSVETRLDQGCLLVYPGYMCT